MRSFPVVLVLFASVVPGAPSSSLAATPGGTAIALPGAPPEGVALDYLAIDRGRHRVWVPAGGTGAVVVIDTKSGAVRRIGDFPTAEVERNGKKRVVGPSSATIGGKFVYVGDRADSSVCAIDAKSLERKACVTLSSMPDGLAYVASRKEVWVTAPREQAILILDVSAPADPKLVSRIPLEGDPEGYAVDDAHGLFFTNFEDKDRTVRIALATRSITATWQPECGEDGPRGLVLADGGRIVVVACPDHLVSLAAASDGHILSKLPTGAGVDDLDYLPSRHAIYAAASADAILAVATLDDQGGLHAAASLPTAKGARNAVAAEDGVAYVACGPEGKILVVPVPDGAGASR